MPLHPDFQKVLKNFKAEYGDERGEKLFWAWVNKNNYDETKSLSSQKKKRKEALRMDKEIRELFEKFDAMSDEEIKEYIDEEGDIVVAENVDLRFSAKISLSESKED